MCSMATASFVIPDHAVTQVKLAARATGSSVAAGGFAKSSTITFQTTATSFTAVTGASVTITTTGRPVFVGYMPDGSNAGWFGFANSVSGSNCGNWEILRGVTVVSNYTVCARTASAIDVVEYPASSLWYIDSPAAGTYTYTVKTQAFANGTNYNTSVVLMAYEL